MGYIISTLEEVQWDIISSVGDVQYCGRILSVNSRMFSTLGNTVSIMGDTLCSGEDIYYSRGTASIVL